MSSTVDIFSLSKSIAPVTRTVKKYRVMIFLLLLAGIYGFIVFRINTLAGIAPDTSAVPATSEASRAHIDEGVAKKIQDLQDNSVSVKSLFDEARQNPFDE